MFRRNKATTSDFRGDSGQKIAEVSMEILKMDLEDQTKPSTHQRKRLKDRNLTSGYDAILRDREEKEESMLLTLLANKIAEKVIERLQEAGEEEQEEPKVRS
jgi:hypothetical protein